MADNAQKALEAKNKGNQNFSAGNYAEAIKCFSEAIELDGSNHVYYSNRSAALVSSGERIDLALEDAEKCISLKSDWPKGYHRKGTALHFLGRYDEAIAAYEEGLKYDFENGPLKEGLATAKKSKETQPSAGSRSLFPPESFVRLGQDPRTQHLIGDQDFMKMLREVGQDPSSLEKHLKDPRLMLAMEVMLGIKLSATPEDMDVDNKQEKDTKKAEPEPVPEPVPEISPEEKAKEEVKEQAMKWKLDGNEHYKQKNFEQALASYGEAVKTDPTNITFRLNRAAVYIEMQEYDKCMAECEEAIVVGRENRASFELIAKVFARMGNCLFKQEKYDEAIQMYNKSLAEHREKSTLKRRDEVERIKKQKEAEALYSPEKAQEDKKKGNDAFREGRYPEAVESYTNAIKHDPEDHTLYSNRAAAYTKLLAYPEGLKDCDKCMSLEPSFVKAYTRKGHLLFFMKKYKEALEVYQKGLEFDANNTELIDGLSRCMSELNRDVNTAQNATPEEVAQRVAANPEVQAILADPVMRQVLDQLGSNPAALQEHLQNPVIAQKIQKLIEVGVLRVGGPPGAQ